eukprot:m.157383 g.157383  ORF g.157383 m.157383 type:complete len:1323 (+) comp14335_c0_seq9:504-4472(+)
MNASTGVAHAINAPLHQQPVVKHAPQLRAHRKRKRTFKSTYKPDLETILEEDEKVLDEKRGEVETLGNGFGREFFQPKLEHTVDQPCSWDVAINAQPRPDFVEKAAVDRLMCSILRGKNKEVAKTLCATPNAVNYRNEHGVTPLFLAIDTNHASIAKLLVRKGANIHLPNEDGRTPIQLLIEHERPNLAQSLVQKYIGRGGITSRQDAAILLRQVARNPRGISCWKWAFHPELFYINCQTEEGTTALHAAVESNNQKTINFLLNEVQGVDLTLAAVGTEENPFHTACRLGNEESILTLLAKMPALLLKLADSKSPLQIALKHCRRTAAKLLLDLGAPARSSSKDGSTPLHTAIRSCTLLEVILLVVAGADVDAKDLQGCTALHLACQQTNFKMVLFLLLAGASPYRRDEQNRLPLEYTHDSSIQTLVQEAAALPTKSRRGWICTRMTSDKDLFIFLESWVYDFTKQRQQKGLPCVSLPAFLPALKTCAATLTKSQLAVLKRTLDEFTDGERFPPVSRPSTSSSSSSTHHHLLELELTQHETTCRNALKGLETVHKRIIDACINQHKETDSHSRLYQPEQLIRERTKLHQSYVVSATHLERLVQTVQQVIGGLEQWQQTIKSQLGPLCHLETLETEVQTVYQTSTHPQPPLSKHEWSATDVVRCLVHAKLYCRNKQTLWSEMLERIKREILERSGQVQDTLSIAMWKQNTRLNVYKNNTATLQLTQKHPEISLAVPEFQCFLRFVLGETLALLPSDSVLHRNLLAHGEKQCQLPRRHGVVVEKGWCKSFRLGRALPMAELYHEAAMLAQIQHPGVVQAIALSKRVDTGQAMLWFAGNHPVSLSELFRGRGAPILSERWVSTLLHRVATTIEDLHNMNIGHFAIDPHSILLQSHHDPQSAQLSNFAYSRKLVQIPQHARLDAQNKDGDEGEDDAPKMKPPTRWPKQEHADNPHFCPLTLPVNLTSFVAPELTCEYPNAFTPACDVYSLGCLLEWLVSPKTFASKSDDHARVARTHVPSSQKQLRKAFLQLITRMTLHMASQRISLNEVLTHKCLSKMTGTDATAHWQTQGIDPVHVDVTETHREWASHMLNQTSFPSEHGKGRDSHSKTFDTFVVEKVYRLENAWLQQRYEHAQIELTSKRRSGHRGQLLSIPVLTSPERKYHPVHNDHAVTLPHPELEVGGADSANEYWLFHGTSWRHLASIKIQGLDHRITQKRGMSGRALYFAESSTKADQYALADEHGMCVMLICRVTLGDMAVVDKPVQRQRPPTKPNGELYDSVVVQSKRESKDAVLHRFRECVIYEPRQCYPEIIVKYRREACHKTA